MTIADYYKEIGETVLLEHTSYGWVGHNFKKIRLEEIKGVGFTIELPKPELIIGGY